MFDLFSEMNNYILELGVLTLLSVYLRTHYSSVTLLEEDLELNKEGAEFLNDDEDVMSTRIFV